MSYQTQDEKHVIRLRDGATIPVDPDNRDYREYLEWVGEGNVPLPFSPMVQPSAVDLDRSMATVGQSLIDLLIRKGVIRLDEFDASAQLVLQEREILLSDLPK